MMFRLNNNLIGISLIIPLILLPILLHFDGEREQKEEQHDDTSHEGYSLSYPFVSYSCPLISWDNDFLSHAIASFIFVCHEFIGILVCCLKLIAVNVPPTARSGDNVRIECKYQTTGDKLYSLTWYFNNREFYRLYPKPPKNSPKSQIFPLNGIDVDVSTWLQSFSFPDTLLPEFSLLSIVSSLMSHQDC
jgi:hypothetical protein